MSIFSRYCRSCSDLFGPAKGRGFTLVELMVVVSVVLIITSFVLLQHSRFDSTTLLRSLSYSIALSMRQAQVFGTSVRGTQGSVTVATGYGVRFTSASDTTYTLFADDGDHVFEASDAVFSTPTLNRGFKIKRFCAVTAAGLAQCSDTGLSELIVYFRRPNPDAIFYSSSAGTNYSYAYVEIQSPNVTAVRTVKVTSTGQIAVCSLGTTAAAC